jgi:hypothetical protein
VIPSLRENSATKLRSTTLKSSRSCLFALTGPEENVQKQKRKSTKKNQPAAVGAV